MIWLLACRFEDVLVAPQPGLERMAVQRRVDPYEAAPRAEPEGVVAFGEVEATRPPVDRSTIERGRDRYAVFCAPCHGLRGDSATPVAAMMPLPPRSLLSDRVRALEDDAIELRIREGYGLMPAYGDRIAPGDAFAVVLYVRALENAVVPVDELPMLGAGP